jgi:hypothetical protein
MWTWSFLRVRRGNYELNRYWEVSLSGTSDKRIVVRGAGADATVITQIANQNVLNVGGQFFSFYNMSFTGGSRGVRLFGTSSLSAPPPTPPNRHRSRHFCNIKC